MGVSSKLHSVVRFLFLESDFGIENMVIELLFDQFDVVRANLL